MPGRRTVLPDHCQQAESSAAVQNSSWFVHYVCFHHPGFWFVCHVKHPDLFDSPDMKNFQQILKRGEDEETRRGCKKDERGNKDAETHSRRHPTMFETRSEHVLSQGYQVGHSIILTVHCRNNLTCVKKKLKVLIVVCVVPQLPVPAAEPAAGLPEDRHLPESILTQ